MTKYEIITHDLLGSWDPCEDGYKRFCELFPNGADLQTALDGLSNDGHEDWAFWLFKKCRDNNLFLEIISKGYKNSGNGNSGGWNSGDWNSGDCNSGYRNSGNGNSGNWNSGGWNSGGWNSGGWNSGFFNSKTPDDILVFNKPCKRDVWERSYKPDFIYDVELTYWVDVDDMSDEDIIADPQSNIRGGQLRTRSYKEAWQHAWDNVDPKDRMRIKDLPNFDADVFFDITGIDLRKENK